MSLPAWLPVWVPGWCREHLGPEPAAGLFREVGMSPVFGLRLTDCPEVMGKAPVPTTAGPRPAWRRRSGRPDAGSRAPESLKTVLTQRKTIAPEVQ